MKTRGGTRRGHLARLHDPSAGIDRHPLGPRKVLPEGHVRGAAVLLDADRAPRAHDGIKDRARVARAEHERDDEQEAEEQRAPGRVCAWGWAAGKSRGGIW